MNRPFQSVRVPLTLAVCLGLASCVTPAEPVASVSVSSPALMLRYSEARRIDLELRVLAPLDEGVHPRVFVHLYERPVQVLRTFDFPFPGEWAPGEEVRHTLRLHQSALGPALHPGRYHLSVGLYDLDGGRWPLEVEGVEIDRMEYEVAEIVVADESSLPVFRFSAGWKPIEPGQDRQILGRRWLGEEGSIWVSGSETVASVWMVLYIPAAVEGVSRMLLESGAEEPRLLLNSRCGGAQLELVGSGRHEVELPVGPARPAPGPPTGPPPGSSDEQGSGAGPAGECELAFEPNFSLLENGHGERRVVQVEALAWSGPDAD